MKPSLPRAAIFDWDNTLVDSWDAIKEAMNGTFGDLGMPSWTMEQVRARCKYAAKDYFPALFGPDWQKAYERYYTHFNAARAEHSAKPRPGAAELLGWFKAQKIPCFVVSNKRGDYLREEAGLLGWNAFFVMLVGATDTANSKPSREPVDKALKSINMIAGPDVWFVGDTDVDMICARASGCTPVFVGHEADAEKLSVALAFEDCQALHDWLESGSRLSPG